MSITQKCNGGPDRSATLRALADLSRSLPAPFGVQFVEQYQSLALDFGSVADLVAWSAQLGLTQMCLRRPSSDGGSLYTNFSGQWRGWNVDAMVLERVGCHGSAGAADVASIRIRETCRCGWQTGWHDNHEGALTSLAGHVSRMRPALPASPVDVPAGELEALNPSPAEAARIVAGMQAVSQLGRVGGVA